MSPVIMYSIFTLIFFGVGVFFYRLGNPYFSTGLGSSIYIACHLIPLGSVALFENAQFMKSGVKFMVIGGIISGLAQVFFFLALRLGQVHVVVPIRNLALVVTVLLGIIFLSETITLTKGIGMFFGVLAIIFLSL